MVRLHDLIHRPAAHSVTASAGKTGTDADRCLQADLDLIRHLPKIELHLHLEGALRLPVLRQLAARHDVCLPERLTAALDSATTRFDSFFEFLESFKLVCSLLREPLDFQLAAQSLFNELEEQHVLHAEIFLSACIFDRAGIDIPACMQALDAASRPFFSRGMRVLWILDSVRQWGPAALQRTIQLAQLCRNWGVAGIGVGGDETACPAADLATLYAEARRLSLYTTAHAGETGSPQHLREVLEKLQPQRIGHGIRAVEDESLLRRLRETRTMLDVCITSNLCTGAWPTLTDHPLCRLAEAGVLFSINSDDPALFKTTLSEEILLAMRLLKRDPAGWMESAVAGIEACFLSPDERRRLRQRFIAAAPTNRGF